MYKRLSFLATGMRIASTVRPLGLSARVQTNFSEGQRHFSGVTEIKEVRINSFKKCLHPGYQLDEVEYDSLPKEDKKTLVSLMNTPCGVYALEKGYITIKAFLGLSLKARLKLSSLFDVYIERPCEEDYHKESLDRLFGNNKFNLKNCLTLTKPKWDYLMNLLENSFGSFTSAIELGAFTLDEFLELDIVEQQALWDFGCEIANKPVRFKSILKEGETVMGLLDITAVCRKMHEQFLVYKERNQAKGSSKDINQDQIRLSSKEFDALFLTIKQIHPEANQDDVSKFIEFTSLLPDAPRPYSHYIESLPAKISLLRMLAIPKNELAEKDIAQTLEELGFEVRRAILLDSVQMELSYRRDFEEFYKADYFIQFSEEIVQVKTIEELETIYLDFKQSNFRNCLRKLDMLDFIISGKLSEKAREILMFHCRNHEYFACKSSYLQKENNEYFVTLKSVFSNMARFLLESQLLPVADEKLLKKIDESQNEADLLRIYKTKLQYKLKLRSFDFNLTKHEVLFADPSRVKEQLYLLSSDANALGVKMTYDEALIEDYIHFTSLILIPRMMEMDDGRSDYYLCSISGDEIKPDNIKIRKKIMNDLEEALRQGELQEKIQDMQRSCLDPNYLEIKSRVSVSSYSDGFRMS